MACLGALISVVIGWLVGAGAADATRANAGRPAADYGAWYLRSGQWLADARTVSSMTRWYFDVDDSKAGNLTNALILPPPATNAAALRRTV